eukprot:COSAG05_NODE_1902_length_3855_cov_11.469649_4_plen_298_part_00
MVNGARSFTLDRLSACLHRYDRAARESERHKQEGQRPAGRKRQLNFDKDDRRRLSDYRGVSWVGGLQRQWQAQIHKQQQPQLQQGSAAAASWQVLGLFTDEQAAARAYGQCSPCVSLRITLVLCTGIWHVSGACCGLWVASDAAAILCHGPVAAKLNFPQESDVSITTVATTTTTTTRCSKKVATTMAGSGSVCTGTTKNDNRRPCNKNRRADGGGYSSQYRGVTLESRTGRWVGQCSAKRKWDDITTSAPARISRSQTCETELEAAKWYDEQALDLHGPEVSLTSSRRASYAIDAL